MGQPALFETSSALAFHKAAGTFTNNASQSIHRWFPYVEGYSYDLVEGILDTLPYQPSFIYDPFGGSGTTMLVSSERAIESGYSEVNPFMRFVTECKVNLTKQLVGYPDMLDRTVFGIEAFGSELASTEFETEYAEADTGFYVSVFGDRGYFDERVLRQILAARERLEQCDRPTRDFLLLALASVLVRVSNLIRRSDLRYRRPEELKDRPNDLRAVLAEKANQIAADLRTRRAAELASTHLNGPDARICSNNFHARADTVITSPPYLNGTNYFRNTKLELWLCGFLSSENDLKAFRTAAVTAGINNVSARIRPTISFPEVEKYATQLDEVAYDKRIPKLVRAYFSDMHQVFLALHATLRPEGRLFLDIGDSVFAGVHVPTHELLVTVAEGSGFEAETRHVLRKRHSKGGAKLTQVLLEFRRQV